MERHPRAKHLAALAAAALTAAGAAFSQPHAASATVNLDALSADRGGTLYERHCASCHGSKGKGDGKAACDLDPSPSDLTDADVAHLTDTQLFRKITNGRRPMPAFKKLMSDQERWEVVRFVRSLASHHGSGEKR